MKKRIHFFFLTAILALLSVNAIAQSTTPGTLGDGDDPYVGTTHNYRVTTGGGTSNWSVLKTDETPADATAFTLGTNGASNIDVTWNTQGDYILRYTEDLNGCLTHRQMGITVRGNTFIVAAEANLETCNSKEDQVLNWDDYDEATDLVKTQLVFTVNMTKDANFTINSWQFTGALTLPAGVTIADASDITITGAGAVVNVSGANNNQITVTGCTAASVDVTVNVSSVVNNGGDVVLAIDNKKALSGVGSSIETDSNGGNNSQTNKLKPLAGSSNISFN